MDELFIKCEAICEVYNSRKYTMELLAEKLRLKENQIRMVLHEYNYFNGKKLTPENTNKLLNVLVDGNKLDFIDPISLNYINSLL